MDEKNIKKNLYAFEREVYSKNSYRYICGVDEAGRGPLAGPVYAAAVILPRDRELPGLDDSKKLSPKKRESLFRLITENAVSYKICSVDEKEIDRTDILSATLKAMEMAVEGLDVKPDMVFIDGNCLPRLTCPARAVIRGDGLLASVAAASILAKVSRDRFMLGQDKLYPQYGFASHKGYPTKQHYRNIFRFGVCPIHRMSFLKNLESHRES